MSGNMLVLSFRFSPGGSINTFFRHQTSSVHLINPLPGQFAEVIQLEK